MIPKVLREQATQVLHKVSNVPGVERAFMDRAGEVPQAIIEIDRDRAARYGLNVGDIEDVIEIGLGGKAATELWEGEKHFQRRRPSAGTGARPGEPAARFWWTLRTACTSRSNKSPPSRKPAAA